MHHNSQFMFRFYILVICLSVLPSCASILNCKTKRVDIITNESARVEINNIPLANVRNRTKLMVPRDISPIEITVFSDSIRKNITIDSKNSFAYWFNIYANVGLGMIYDKDRAKRYSYPNRVYVDIRNSENSYTSYYSFQKEGDLLLHVSLPHINSFNLNPIGEDSSILSLGFWGAKIGLDYYHHDRQFLNLSASAVSDFFVPVPAAIDISGEYDLMSSAYLSISNNHKINRYSIGYGLSYSRNTWDHRYYDRFDPPPPLREPVKKTDYSLGLVFPLYCQFGDNFSLGMVYRPSFLKLQPEKSFKYEHLISADFAWKFFLIK